MTGRVPDRIRPGQAIDTAFDETSRPVSANFSAKPDSRLIRDAIRAVVGVDVDASTRLLGSALRIGKREPGISHMPQA